MTTRKTRKRGNGEGTVYEDKARSRPDRRVWRISVSLPDGRRRSERYVGPKREALKVRDRLQTEAEATGTGPRAPRGARRAWTVGTWLSYWQTSVIGARKGRHGTGISRKTLNREAWAAAEIQRALGSRSLRTLTSEDVEEFLGQRAAGIGVERRPWSAGSCQDVKNLLARALDVAINRGHAPAPNKARYAAIPGHARLAEEQFSLMPAEARELYRAARADGSAAALVIAFELTTGMRPGEVRRLHWGHVDLEQATARIIRAHAKTPSSVRTVSLAPPALAVLRQAASAAELRRRDPAAHVFPGMLRSPCVTERALIEKLNELCLELGITVDPDEPRAPHPHEMRHTFASLLADRGITTRILAGILGDQPETVDRTYTHNLKTVQGEAEAVDVSALFGEAS